MRLWSLHPEYLDARGLVACWREGLLARKVLKGETRGYRNHPQLERFRASGEPLALLERYLSFVLEEATKRGYSFNRDKIDPGVPGTTMEVTTGQLEFELHHLRKKLKTRNIRQYEVLADIVTPLANPVFNVITGKVEPWERGHGKNPIS